MATKAKQEKAVRLVKNILQARRNQNLKAETTAHRKLVDWCQEENFDFDHVYDGAVRRLKTSIAAMMNGLV